MGEVCAMRFREKALAKVIVAGMYDEAYVFDMQEIINDIKTEYQNYRTQFDYRNCEKRFTKKSNGFGCSRRYYCVQFMLLTMGFTECRPIWKIWWKHPIILQE